MRTFIVLIILSFAALIGKSQDAYASKLDRLWKRNPDRCIRKAERYIKKERALPTAHYYRVAYYYSKAKNEGNYNHWIKVAEACSEAIEHPAAELPRLLKEIENASNVWAYTLPNKEMKIWSAKHLIAFGDTLQAYAEYLIIKGIDNRFEPLPVFRDLDSLRTSLLDYAQQFIGIPYKWAGEDPSGFDCSGFTKYVFNNIGIELPHNAHMQANLPKGQQLSLEEALPGDLVFFGTRSGKDYRVTHTGIVLENTPDTIKVIHSANSGVRIDGDNPSWEHYWKDKVLFAKSFLTSE